MADAKVSLAGDVDRPGDKDVRIIVLEDHDRMRLSVLRTLKSLGGWNGTPCATIGELVETVSRDGPPSLIVSGEVLPDGHVEDVHRQLGIMRRGVKVLALLNNETEVDAVQLANSGIHSYVKKPFTPHQVVTRVADVLRLPNPVSALGGGRGIVLDANRFLTIKGWPGQVHLTPKEGTLLEVLAKQAGDVVTKDDVYMALHDRRAEFEDRSVDQLISGLRSKLKKKPFSDFVLIETVRGVGYRLVLKGL